MLEDKNGDLVKDNAIKNYEALTTVIGKSALEYVARAKGLASAVKYYGRAELDEEICRRIAKSLPPAIHFVRVSFCTT